MKKILMSTALLAAAVSFAFAGELGDIYFNKEFNPIGVHRWFEETPTPADMVKSILRGPNGDEMEDGIFSAVPANWVLDSVTENGAFIDINMKPVPKGTLYETGEIEDIWVQFDKTLRYRFGLTPRLFIDGNPIDDYEVPVPDFSCDKPFIPKNERMRTAASGPLSGKLIAVRGGHGWCYLTSQNRWATERGENCSQYISVEDFHTQELALILITYLEQEGASIVHCREPNHDRGNCQYSGKPWWQMSPIAYMADAGYPSNLYGGSAYADMSNSRYAASNLANYRGADMYLSIHTNALGGDCYSNCGTGLEAFWSSNNSSSGSQRIAQLALDNCLSMIRNNYDSSFACRRGCQAIDANYAETRRATMPSTLFEFAFHDNCAKDAQYLADNFFRTLGMWGVAQAVYQYYGITPRWGAYSAEYVGNSIPDQVAPGETRSVTVTFKNHGLCWQGGRGFKLGSPGDNDPFAAARQALPAEIMPGQYCTFTFNMTFPSTPGVYTTDWQMYRDGVGFFGDVFSKQVTVGTPERGAVMVSNTIPDSVTQGETRNVSITVRNVGSKTWSSGEHFALGIVGESDPFYTTSNRVALTRAVAQGETYTFNFEMRFPTAGTFTTDWQMVQDGVGWFGDTLAKDVTVNPIVERGAAMISNTIPDSVNAGETRSVSITVKNTGTLTWTAANGFALGIVDESDPFYTVSNRVPLTRAVAPGETYTFTFDMSFPTAGTFTTDWRMVQDGVTWFGDTLAKNVTVNTVAQPLDAQIVSNTIPDVVNVGESRTVNVVVKNTGTLTWTPGGANYFALAAGGDNDPFAVSIRCGVESNVAPGGTYTFSFTMNFPTAGTFNTDWQMGQEGVGRFGTVLSKNVTVTAPERGAQMVSNTIPDSVTVGETRTVTVTVKNTGSATWTPGGSNYYALAAGDDNDPFAASIRCGLDRNVAPGETYTFSFSMTFPSAGTFTTDWQMGQEGVTRFGEVLSKNVTVTGDVFNAKVISENIPTSMNTGETRHVSITMKNTGTESWHLSKDDYLGSPGNSDPFALARHGVVTEVAPGGTYTFNFDMTAPSTPGTYTTDWQMIREYVAWYGEIISKNITVSSAELNAQMVSNTIPSAAIVGETKSVSITVKNTGTSTWSEATFVRLGIVDESDPFYQTSNRVILTKAVAPGETYTFTFDMSFPTAGTFTTDWQMIKDGVAWFGDILAKDVTVSAPVRAAQMISNTIPDTAALGETRSVSVTVKNTGNVTWTPGGNNYFALSAGDDNDPFAASIRCGVANNVNPGDTYTFTFDMTFSAAGTFTTDWQMGQEGVGRFGDILSKNVTVSAPVFDARITANTIPDTMYAGETRTVSVTVKNVGTESWNLSKDDYLGSPGNSDPFAPARHGVVNEVRSGQTYVFNFRMTAPTTPGTYTTDWQMIREYVAWYGDVLTKQVKVNAAPNATTYYVSPNGNDDNNGTSRTTPWKTITNGDVKGILNPGDTVIIMAGTYNVSGAMNDRAIRLIDCAGTSVAPITYRGESGAKVVGGGSGLTTCLQVSANYIVIDGLELTGAAFPLCSNHNAAGLVIKNCKIHDTSYVTSIEPRSAGIYLEADNCNATVSNCEIYNIGIDAGRRCAGIYNMSGYWLTNGVRSTYHHNYIHDIGGDGLGFYIRGGATDDHVYNNTVTNVNCGTYSENGSANHGSLTATNNIFVNCSTAVFGCDASGGFSTINNYNLVWNSGENIGYGQGTIFADPQFTTVPVISGASDAVNRGVDVGLPYNGAAPDMGCYETDYTQCVWDIYKDYSVVNNPNGVWNFGWELPRTGSNGTTFTKYTLLDEAGQGDRAWRAADDFDDHGYVGYRPVAGVHNEWQQWRKPYTVFLGSTFGAGWTTVRFTAPYANTYTFEIKFQACGQTDNYTTVYIDKNGTNLYTDLLTGTMYGDAAETEKNTLYRTFTLNLNAGDRIDLVKTNPTPVGSCSLLPIFRVTAGNQQCIVSGTVTSSYGGGAVSGAVVKVGNKTGTTGSDGKYNVVVDRTNSAQSVTVTANGYADYTGTVTPSGATVTKNITLSAKCVVSGKVTDGYGNVSGAQIKNGNTVLAVTDGSGNYSFTVNRSGSTMNLTAAASGHTTGTGSVVPNDAAKTVNFNLTAQCTISGKVTDAFGPVSGAKIKVGGTEKATTDSSGNYSFVVNRSGAVTALTATAANHRDGTGSVTPNAATATCNITMTATCAVSGKVTDAFGPVSGAKIKVGGAEKATTDGSGNYSFTVDKSTTAMTLTATAADHRDGTGTVTPNAASVTCNITMTAICVVGGKVTDGYGPVSGAQIYLGGSLKATTDGNGDYSFTVDKSDTAMTLTAKADDHRDGTASATPNAGSVTCDITLTATCVVKGTVTSALDGEPVAGALVTVGGETDTTDEYGGYRITADRAPGAEINVTAEGYAPYGGTVFTDDTGVMKDVVLEPAGTVITDAEELKAAEVGEYVDVVFDAKAMNGSFDFNDGSVYIEAGLFTGYKVIIPDGVLTVKGDVFTFRGQVESDGDGKYVRATSIKPVSTGNPVRTLGMTNHILTSNALVRVWGRAASVGEDSFILSNAYGDITVKIEAADAPDEGDFAVVTGIAGPNGIRAIEIIN